MPKDVNLYIVPTPIGNLEDITLRALNILKEADLILAEDTRVSRRLLQHYQIDKPLRSYHQANEHHVVQGLVEQLQSGTVAALITDAGTPGISDPGFLLIRECIAHCLEVQCLPGATAFVPALVSSGLPSDKFCFEGFLPHKKGRQTRLKILAEDPRTIILYESPHRLLKTLGQVMEFFGEERPVSISREISKMFEETVRGTAKELYDHFSSNPIKGEFVVIIGGHEEK